MEISLENVSSDIGTYRIYQFPPSSAANIQEGSKNYSKFHFVK